MTPENLKTFIEQQVDYAMDLIFNNAHSAAMTTSGDITPEQQLQLDNIQDQLKNLVYTQVMQNLPQAAELERVEASFAEELIDAINDIQQSGINTTGVNIPNDEWFSDEQFDVIRRLSRIK